MNNNDLFCIDDEMVVIVISNYTSHNIYAYSKGTSVQLFSVGTAYVEIKKEKVESTIGLGLPIYKKSYGEVKGLPPESKDEDGRFKEYYLVSREVAEALKGQRDDLLIMDDVVYDRRGHIIGCKSFIKLWSCYWWMWYCCIRKNYLILI